MEMFKGIGSQFYVSVFGNGVRMHVTQVEDCISLIDVETAGIENFIASYVLKGRQIAIVETGPASSIPNLLSGLGELDVKPEDVAYVAVSHIHLDHGGGVGTLIKHLPNAEVIVHQRGAPHLVNPVKLWDQSRMVLGTIADMYGKPEPVPREKVISAGDGMEFKVGNGVGLRVVETTGHASHHQSYYETSSRGVFPGDAAGIYMNRIDVIVPTTPAPFRLDIALASIEKLISLKPEHLFYSHFGRADDSFTKLQTYAKQLTLWAKIAKQGIENKESLDVISKRILDSDKNVREAAKYIKAHTILNKTVLSQSVQGVVEFVKSEIVQD
jgi:glyoxylase-like metal-dependent hydrolase (beta-lactamase superfamily II)